MVGFLEVIIYYAVKRFNMLLLKRFQQYLQLDSRLIKCSRDKKREACFFWMSRVLMAHDFTSRTSTHQILSSIVAKKHRGIGNIHKTMSDLTDFVQQVFTVSNQIWVLFLDKSYPFVMCGFAVFRDTL